MDLVLGDEGHIEGTAGSFLYTSVFLLWVWPLERSLA